MYRLLASMLLVIALAACGAPQGPQASLAVASVVPAEDAVVAATNAVVAVTFDRAIVASTLASRFTVERSSVPVAGSVRYVEGTRSASFIPETPLAPGVYTATVSSGVQGADGTVLMAERSWTFEVTDASPGDPSNGDPGNGDPEPTDPTDPDDPAVTDADLRAAFLSPTPNKRTAGLVNVELDLEAELGIKRAELFVDGDEDSGSVRVARWDDDPDADPVEREMLSVSFSTLDYETGAYSLRVRLEDRAGNVLEQMLAIEFLTPFLITNPIDEDGVGIGNDRQIVAITIGVNGTILDDYDVTSVDIYINGTLYAAGIPVDDDATSTRLIVYPWDTDEPGLGGHPTTLTGDRAITARVYFVDPATEALRNEFTPGVIVNFLP